MIVLELLANGDLLTYLRRLSPTYVYNISMSSLSLHSFHLQTRPKRTRSTAAIVFEICSPDCVWYGILVKKMFCTQRSGC